MFYFYFYCELMLFHWVYTLQFFECRSVHVETWQKSVQETRWKRNEIIFKQPFARTGRGDFYTIIIISLEFFQSWRIIILYFTLCFLHIYVVYTKKKNWEFFLG